MALEITWVKNPNGTPPLIREYPFDLTPGGGGADRTQLKKGTPMVYDTSDDRVVEQDTLTAAALGILIVNTGSPPSRPTALVEGDLVPVLIPSASDIFMSTWSASATADGTTDSTDIGNPFSIVRRTSPTADVGKYTAVDSAANPWLFVLDLDPRDAEGATTGLRRVLFAFDVDARFFPFIDSNQA